MHLDSIFPSQVCTQCRKLKSMCDFSVQSFERDYLSAKCTACVSERTFKRRKSNPNQKLQDRKYNLRHHSHGMTVDRYNELFAAQGGVCAICHKPETALRSRSVKRLAVDHSHKTGQNRGLLCSRCNVAIGYFGDSIELLWSAIGYLHQHATN